VAKVHPAAIFKFIHKSEGYSHPLATPINSSNRLRKISFARPKDVAAFEDRQPVTAAKFINKSSLFILLLNVIRRLELKSISE